MRNNTVYKQLEQLAIDGGYSIAQVAKADYEQVCGLLKIDDLSETVFENMKELLQRRLQARDDETDKQFLISKVDVAALRQRFSYIEFEKSREQGKRKITLWLDGK